MAKKAGHGNDASQLGLQLSDLTLVDGQQMPLETQLVQTSAGSSNLQGQDAATIGTTTGVGAAIGAIAADGGAGAAIGAGAGAIAGMIGVLSTHVKADSDPSGNCSFVPIGSPGHDFNQEATGQFAFQPVTQDDYDSHSRPGPAVRNIMERLPVCLIAPGCRSATLTITAIPTRMDIPMVTAILTGVLSEPRLVLEFYGGYGFGRRFGGFRGGFRR